MRKLEKDQEIYIFFHEYSCYENEIYCGHETKFNLVALPNLNIVEP